MDFSIPKDITDLLARIDAFIEAEIVPLQRQDDNERFFDHRREWARTDFEGGGLPRKDWEALLREIPGIEIEIIPITHEYSTTAIPSSRSSQRR